MLLYAFLNARRRANRALLPVTIIPFSIINGHPTYIHGIKNNSWNNHQGNDVRSETGYHSPTVLISSISSCVATCIFSGSKDVSVFCAVLATTAPGIIEIASGVVRNVTYLCV